MKLAVFGLGKLGSPLATVLAHRGHEVMGFDLVERVVADLSAGRAPVEETGLQDLLDTCADRVSATTDIEVAVAASDVSFVIVPTPSDATGRFSLDHILDVVTGIGRAVRSSDRRHCVVITSTVMPGATDGPIREALEAASGLVVGDTIGLCYSPEFIALGSVVHDLLNPDLILVGESDPASGDQLEAILSGVALGDPPVMRMNLVNAELAKISVNTFVTTKISYANMLADVCELLPGADASVVAAAVGLDSRIGSKYMRPATSFGGPCFPRDNKAFSVMARDLGTRADLAEATDVVNQRQVDRLAGHVLRNLPDGGRAAILGLTYKPDTAVIEESAGIALAQHLVARGVPLTVFDPVATAAAERVLGSSVTFATGAREAVAAADVVVVATAWPELATLTADDLRACGTVIDCWGLLDRSIGASVNLVRPGVGLDQAVVGSAAGDPSRSQPEGSVVGGAGNRGDNDV